MSDDRLKKMFSERLPHKALIFIYPKMWALVCLLMAVPIAGLYFKYNGHANAFQQSGAFLIVIAVLANRYDRYLSNIEGKAIRLKEMGPHLTYEQSRLIEIFAPATFEYEIANYPYPKAIRVLEVAVPMYNRASSIATEVVAVAGVLGTIIWLLG